MPSQGFDRPVNQGVDSPFSSALVLLPPPSDDDDNDDTTSATCNLDEIKRSNQKEVPSPQSWDKPVRANLGQTNKGPRVTSEFNIVRGDKVTALGPREWHPIWCVKRTTAD
jgi:hypothetical protein